MSGIAEACAAIFRAKSVVMAVLRTARDAAATREESSPRPCCSRKLQNYRWIREGFGKAAFEENGAASNTVVGGEAITTSGGAGGFAQHKKSRKRLQQEAGGAAAGFASIGALADIFYIFSRTEHTHTALKLSRVSWASGVAWVLARSSISRN